MCFYVTIPPLSGQVVVKLRSATCDNIQNGQRIIETR
jgi:hypothetical protein